MKSMTGYGKGSALGDGLLLEIEIKCVNNRFLEINNRVPKSLVCFDALVRRRVGEVVKRGTVDVFYAMTAESGLDKTVCLDIPLAKQLVAAAKRLRAECALENDFQLTALMRSTDVVKYSETNLDQDKLKVGLETALGSALKQLDTMRLTEGAGIARDLTSVLGEITNNLSAIAARAPKLADEYKSRLIERVKLTLDAVPLDENKLLNEVAYYIDKVDTNEEISRLGSHIGQFLSALESGGEQGRKLDFLTQEIGREANTIGSKCCDLETTGFVLAVKNNIERLKEQIRNVE